MQLNRRHKAGILLTVVLAGFGLLLEYGLRQVAGIVLLGLAGTWLVGSVPVPRVSVKARKVMASAIIAFCAARLFLVAAETEARREVQRAAVAEYQAKTQQVATLKELIRRYRKGEPPTPRYTVDEMAAEVKRKYPAYKDWPSEHLVRGIITKYPEYRDWLAPGDVRRLIAAAPPRPRLTIPDTPIFPRASVDAQKHRRGEVFSMAELPKPYGVPPPPRWVRVEMPDGTVIDAPTGVTRGEVLWPLWQLYHVDFRAYTDLVNEEYGPRDWVTTYDSRKELPAPPVDDIPSKETIDFMPEEPPSLMAEVAARAVVLLTLLLGLLVGVRWRWRLSRCAD